MKKEPANLSGVTAVIAVAIVVGLTLYFETNVLITQKTKIQNLRTLSTETLASNKKIEHRIGLLAAEKSRIQNLWREMNASIYRYTLLQSQGRPLYEIGARSIDPLNNEPGSERRYFGFATTKAEFHRITQAVADVEKEMIFAQIKRLKIELPPTAKPLGLDATYLTAEGEFALPAEDSRTTAPTSVAAATSTASPSATGASPTATPKP